MSFCFESECGARRPRLPVGAVPRRGGGGWGLVHNQLQCRGRDPSALRAPPLLRRGGEESAVRECVPVFLSISRAA